METSTWVILNILIALFVILIMIWIFRCWIQGRPCPSKCAMDGKTCLITSADTPDGIELVRELSRRGSRIIMGCIDVELGQDVALDIRAETNGEIVVEHVDLKSVKSIREFCTKILETESRIHVLINNGAVQWVPEGKTSEGFEIHWGVNHIATFIMTQLLLPLIYRGAPDARIITLTSSLYKRSPGIRWDDTNFNNSKYSACKAFAQTKLANILFTRELSRRLDGTNVNTYAVDPGVIRQGLGRHIFRGLGCPLAFLACCFWLPMLKSPENGIHSIVYCASDDGLEEQSGFYYRDCAVQLTTDKASNMDDAYRLWEMTERMAGLTS